jgi:putative transposase
MAHPARRSAATNIREPQRTFFVSSRTSQGAAILQTERMANLFLDVLRSYVAAGKFRVHDFVVMRNHFHLLLTLKQEMSVEKAVQLIKGNFSYRAKKELGYQREVWQRGFSEVRVYDRDSFLYYRIYIDQNPVKAGYVSRAEDYPYCSAYFRKASAAKAGSLDDGDGPSKLVP